MNTKILLLTLAAATLSLTAVRAEDSGQTETTDQKQQQSSDMVEMKDMGKGPMMSGWTEQDAELDKLVAEMNSAPADKKLDAVATLLTKLVEQRKAMHEQMQKMMSADEKEAMAMCRMMMGMKGSNTEHSHHQHE
jgi:hypothetical protein